jgi:hypothetical protein
LGYQDDSFGNAAGFSGNPTRGLINVNTASPEVLRTLPHMSRLAYNDSRAWRNTDSGVWQGYAPANPIRGDVGPDGVPRDIAQRNNHWVRIPEMIARYRDGESMVKRVEQAPYVFSNPGLLASVGNEALPVYTDRGTLNPDFFSGGVTLAEWVSSNITYPSYENTIGLFPGMRRDKGISSIGELMLLGRTGAFGTGGWSGSSPSIRSAGLDPYFHQSPLTNIYGAQMPDGFGVDPLLLGIGWRSSGVGNPPVQADARLSTDVQHTSFRTFAGDEFNAPVTVEIPDNVAMDAEEANMLFAGMSNLISTRSDTFTVYIKIRSFKQNPVSGVWNAMDPEYVVDDSRYVMVVDRSKCELPTDEPEIRLHTQVPN